MGIHSTTIAEGASFQLCAYWARVAKSVPHACVLNLGWGGRGIMALSPGGEIYEDALRAIDRVCTLLESRGFAPYVEYVDFDQGEGDTRFEGWGEAVVALRDHFNAEVRKRTGQSSEIPWLLCQPSSFFAGCDAMVRSQYALCKARPDEFIQTGPNYHCTYQADLVHRSEGSHARKGEFNGLCVARALYQKRNPAVLQWSSIEYDEKLSVIRLTPSIPVWRDHKIKDPGSWGFNVYDGAGDEVVISKVKICHKGRSVELYMSRALSEGPLRRVDYALNSRYINKRENYNDRPRGQIRTKNPFGTTYHKHIPLYGYMPHSREYF